MASGDWYESGKYQDISYLKQNSFDIINSRL
jgi:hypothetical protein